MILLHFNTHFFPQSDAGLILAVDMPMSFYIRSKIFINKIFKDLFTTLQQTLPGPEFGKTWIVFIPYIGAATMGAAVSVFYSKLFHYIETSVLYTAAQYPLILLLITPLCFYLAWLLVITFAPAASGSGIPQLMASLDLVTMNKSSLIDKLLSFKMSVIKIISSAVALAGGAAIGREGPTLQISAAIFYLTHRYLPSSWIKLNLQKMLIAGGSAGLAAAFNTPLGGIVFAIEELTKTHISNIRSSMFIAVIVAGMTAQLFLGPYLYLGYPQVAAFALSQIPYVLLIAALGGFASGWSCSIILAIFRWKRSLKKIWMNHFFVIVSGFAMALLIVAFGPLAAGSGRETLLTLLFPSDVHVEWYLLPARFAGSIISYSAGLAGGVFAPALSTGATIGALVVDLFHLDPNNKIFILCGMIAFLTGVTHSPFTSSILVLEMTDRHAAIFPMMLAGLIANVAAKAVSEKSFYDTLKENFLPPEEQESPTPEKL